MQLFGGSRRARVIRVAGAVHDVLCAGLAIVLAYTFRVGEFPDLSGGMLVMTASAMVAAAVFFYLFGLNQGSWRYASLEDLFGIVQTAVMSTLTAVLITFAAARMESVPRTVPLLAVILMVVMMGGTRLIYRVWKDRVFQRVLNVSRGGENILLIGYSDEADVFMRNLGKQRTPSYRVVGIVDHTARHVGRRLHAVKVVGSLDDLPELLAEWRKSAEPIAKLVVSPSKVSEDDMTRIVEIAADVGLPLFRLPPVAELVASDGATAIKPKAIRLDDLLGRQHADIDLSPVAEMLKGRTVLVTGGGGSIGSELVLQIAGFKPRDLFILDHSEFNLYAIDQTLRRDHPGVGARPLLCDVRDRAAVHAIVLAAKPDIVFHAAALKHVPIVEDNVIEGAKTNVLGTINVADAAVAAEARAFVMISTDKAVNPTNVMGATKRFAEAYCQSLDLTTTATKFMTVRFGNVLGSAGSVVPLFQEQIKRGGPVTVTHPDMKRYFMTISEAVKLVLSASARGLSRVEERGRIMVLDMGRPVRIVDLAHRMIQLAGRRPGVDVQIHFTGLRPGEKLFEERLAETETVEDTEDAWLQIASPRDVDGAALAGALVKLEDAVSRRDEASAIRAIREVVPELSSQHQALRQSDVVRAPSEPIPFAEARTRIRK